MGREARAAAAPSVPIGFTSEQARLAREGLGAIVTAVDDNLVAVFTSLPEGSRQRDSIAAARIGLDKVRELMVDGMMAAAERLAREHGL